MLADSLLHWYHMVPCTIPVVDRVVKGKHAPSFVVSPFTLVFNQDYLSNVQTHGSMKLLLSHHSTGGWWIRIATIKKNHSMHGSWLVTFFKISTTKFFCCVFFNIFYSVCNKYRFYNVNLEWMDCILHNNMIWCAVDLCSRYVLNMLFLKQYIYLYGSNYYSFQQDIIIQSKEDFKNCKEKRDGKE